MSQLSQQHSRFSCGMLSQW